jgi:hypothetical protein
LDPAAFAIRARIRNRHHLGCRQAIDFNGNTSWRLFGRSHQLPEKRAKERTLRGFSKSPQSPAAPVKPLNLFPAAGSVERISEQVRLAEP